MLKRIRTPSLEIAFEETGTPDGSPVVLLHGFPYDVRAYDEVAAPLAPRCRVLVPYLRGFGPTRFLSAETMRSGQQAALGADLLAFLEALEIERAIVGDYDWGGRAAADPRPTSRDCAHTSWCPAPGTTCRRRRPRCSPPRS